MDSVTKLYLALRLQKPDSNGEERALSELFVAGCQISTPCFTTEAGRNGRPSRSYPFPALFALDCTGRRGSRPPHRQQRSEANMDELLGIDHPPTIGLAYQLWNPIAISIFRSSICPWPDRNRRSHLYSSLDLCRYSGSEENAEPTKESHLHKKHCWEAHCICVLLLLWPNIPLCASKSTGKHDFTRTGS